MLRFERGDFAVFRVSGSLGAVLRNVFHTAPSHLGSRDAADNTGTAIYGAATS